MRASYAPSETDLIHRAHEAFSELTHLYQTAPVGMYLMNRDLRYVRINELLARTDNVSVEDHIGRKLREVIPSVADKLEPVIPKVIETDEAVLNFEPAVVKRKVRVGLASMEERARLIHGDLTIRAEPGKGTGIFVRVPLPEAMA